VLLVLPHSVLLGGVASLPHSVLLEA